MIDCSHKNHTIKLFVCYDVFVQGVRNAIDFGTRARYRGTPATKPALNHFGRTASSQTLSLLASIQFRPKNSLSFAIHRCNEREFLQKDPQTSRGISFSTHLNIQRLQMKDGRMIIKLHTTTVMESINPCTTPQSALALK